MEVNSRDAKKVKRADGPAVGSPTPEVFHLGDLETVRKWAWGLLGMLAIWNHELPQHIIFSSNVSNYLSIDHVASINNHRMTLYERCSS